MTRSLGATIFALLFLAEPALALDTSDPAGLVRDIFARYRKDGPGFSISGREAAGALAPGLLALIRADEKATPKGEVGVLDFDPICSCQDYDIRDPRIEVKANGPDKAEVRVDFKNLGSAQTTRLSLVKTASGWRIADVASKGMPSLVAFMRKALKK